MCCCSASISSPLGSRATKQSSSIVYTYLRPREVRVCLLRLSHTIQNPQRKREREKVPLSVSTGVIIANFSVHSSDETHHVYVGKDIHAACTCIHLEARRSDTRGRSRSVMSVMEDDYERTRRRRQVYGAIPLFRDEEAKASARAVFEADALGLVAENTFNVVASVQLVIEAVRHCHRTSGITILYTHTHTERERERERQ